MFFAEFYHYQIKTDYREIFIENETIIIHGILVHKKDLITEQRTHICH